MSRRSWTAFFSIIAAGLLLCFGIAACSTPKAVIDSAYDLAGMLASNPRGVPKALENMGFEAMQPEAIEWENKGLLDYPQGVDSASLTFDGISVQDLTNGRAPDVAQIALLNSSYVDDRKVGTSTNNLMDFTGFEKPFYNEQTPDEQSDGLVRRLVGHVDEDKVPAAYWSIEIYQHPATDTMPREHSDYFLTAWTEEAAQSSENAWMQEALAAEKA